MAAASTSAGRLAAAAAALCLLCAPLYGAASRQPDIGVRAISMGGAFVAAASDATAINWNPAAIATLQRRQVRLSYADRFGLGLRESYLSSVLPLTESHAFGADWFHRGFDDVEGGLGLDASQNRFGLAYGYRNSIERRRFFGDSAAGVTVRYIAQKASLDGAAAMDAGGFGFDAGLLVPLTPALRFGLAVQDIAGTAVEHENGFREDIMSTHLRLGLAYKPPLGGLTLAADLDDYFRAGAEYWISPQLALRAGLKSEIETPESRGQATSINAGFGLRNRYVQLDYAYENPPVLGATHYVSVGLEYDPNAVTIKAAAIGPRPVFRSLYQHYRETDFFEVVLSNSASEPITVVVALMLPKAMDAANTGKIELPPQSTEKYRFGADFDEELFNRPGAYFDNYVTPVVRVRYTRNDRNYLVEKRLERVYLAGKGKLSWNVEGMAAAFVTPADIAVAAVARGLIQRYGGLLAGKFANSNIGRAAVLFDAMGAYGVRYQADPETPFASVSEDRTIFDTVQYPSELLAPPEGEGARTGDCDDLTVLYASLLENLGIGTAFLETSEPGRGGISLMFDSGVLPEEAGDHFVSRTEYVEWEGRLWIPVQTTMFGSTFSDAWKEGAAEYKRLKVRDLVTETYVRKWMQTYIPAVLAPVAPRLPAEAAVSKLLSRDTASLDKRADRIVLGAAPSLRHPEGAYEAGVAYMRADHLEKAAQMFDRVLKMDPGHEDALNAKGVALTKQGLYDEALALFRQALEIADRPAVRMNVAIAYYLKGERETASMIFDEVVQLDDSYRELFEFLEGTGF